MQAITIAHTPDADDAFMFYALTAGKVSAPGINIAHVLKPIQELNEAAKTGAYEMSALSFAAFPSVADKYSLLPCGACMGYKHGPLLLSKENMSLQNLDRVTVAIPGRLTTAFLVLKMINPRVQTVEVPFDKIVEAVTRGEADAGLIIHEAQLTYERSGLKKVVDLGEWWFSETALPLPLGGNVIRQDLEPGLKMAVTGLFRDSINYALANRDEAAQFAMRYARGLSAKQAKHFIGIYVNETTLDYGETGKEALRQLFDRAYKAGAISQAMEETFF